MEEPDATTTERSLQELIRSETRLESVLAGMLDPVVTMDPFGTIRSANPSCALVFGYEPDELVGENIKLLMPEPYHSEHDRYLAQYRQTGKTNILGRTREFPVRRKDGEEIVIELSVSLIEVPGQTERLYCGSFRDVTARAIAQRSLAESEQRFRAIFEQEFQFVGLLTPDGIVLEANGAALEAAGVQREAVVGKPFWETQWWSHSKEERTRLREAIREAAAGAFVRFETTHNRPDGRISNIDFSLKPFRNNADEIVLLLPEGRDITEIKRAQQRETSMMRAFAEIGESASLLAHEIKNPITAVNLALRAVAKQLGEDDQAVLGELVERMQKMEKLMRRTLSFARPLDLHLAECDISSIFQAAADFLRPHIKEACMSLDLVVAEDCPPLSVDPQLMEEVLTNLIRNAIDAMESGGKIRLAAAGQADDVLIRVDDNGPGIPESIRTTLFKPFVSTKATGTGIGLALARKVVEAHGGSIRVHDSPMGGARFEVRVPALGSGR